MSVKRRMPASSGYIGAGNKTSVFNRKPKIAFEKIRSHLYQEFDKINYKKRDRQKLSENQREQIKSRIRKQLREDRRKEVLYAVIAVLLTLALVFLAMVYLI